MRPVGRGADYRLHGLRLRGDENGRGRRRRAGHRADGPADARRAPASTCAPGRARTIASSARSRPDRRCRRPAGPATGCASPRPGGGSRPSSTGTSWSRRRGRSGSRRAARPAARPVAEMRGDGHGRQTAGSNSPTSPACYVFEYANYYNPGVTLRPGPGPVPGGIAVGRGTLVRKLTGESGKYTGTLFRGKAKRPVGRALVHRQAVMKSSYVGVRPHGQCGRVLRCRQRLDISVQPRQVCQRIGLKR